MGNPFEEVVACGSVSPLFLLAAPTLRGARSRITLPGPPTFVSWCAVHPSHHTLTHRTYPPEISQNAGQLQQPLPPADAVGSARGEARRRRRAAVGYPNTAPSSCRGRTRRHRRRTRATRFSFVASKRCPDASSPSRGNTNTRDRQGLTLVHFSAQLEPCLSQESTLHTLSTP
jgi:hypothetical protein